MSRASKVALTGYRLPQDLLPSLWCCWQTPAELPHPSAKPAIAGEHRRVGGRSTSRSGNPEKSFCYKCIAKTCSSVLVLFLTPLTKMIVLIVRIKLWEGFLIGLKLRKSYWSLGAYVADNAKGSDHRNSLFRLGAQGRKVLNYDHSWSWFRRNSVASLAKSDR